MNSEMANIYTELQLLSKNNMSYIILRKKIYFWN